MNNSVLTVDDWSLGCLIDPIEKRASEKTEGSMVKYGTSQEDLAKADKEDEDENQAK